MNEWERKKQRETQRDREIETHTYKEDRNNARWKQIEWESETEKDSQRKSCTQRDKWIKKEKCEYGDKEKERDKVNSVMVSVPWDS